MGRKRQKGNKGIVDMSLPASQRGRRKRGTPKASKAVRAQMDHASGAKGEKRRRDMAKKQPVQKKKSR